MNTSITIANVNEAVNQWISERAQQRGVPTEKIILELIEREIAKETAQTYHDLDALAGTWEEPQAREFLMAIHDFGKIEGELWR